MSRNKKTIALAIWRAWKELNTIRACAQDGAPWGRYGGIISKSSVDEEYFSQVVDDLEVAFKMAAGEEIKPWPPV